MFIDFLLMTSINFQIPGQIDLKLLQLLEKYNFSSHDMQKRDSMMSFGGIMQNRI